TVGAIVLSQAALARSADYPRSVPLPRDTPEPAYERLKVAASDRTELVVHEWAPLKIAAGKPVILFVHGIGMHGEPYAAIAAGFTSRGITFTAPDLRGHGRSQGERGTLPPADVLRADIDTVLELVEERHPGAPVILRGESM